MRDALAIGAATLAALVFLVFAFLGPRYTARWYGSRVHDQLLEAKRELDRDPANAEARQVVLGHFQGNFSFGRLWACKVFEELGPKAKWALPHLVAAMHADDPYVQREAPLAIGAMGESAADAVPHLIQYLRTSDDSDSRAFTIEALGEIGEPAVPAIPIVEELGRNHLFEYRAERTLEKLRPLAAEVRECPRADAGVESPR